MNKKSGVYFNLHDESFRSSSDLLEDFYGSFLYKDKSSGESDGASFRVRVSSQGLGVLLGNDPLPNFYLDESTGMLYYSDDVEGSPLESQVELRLDGSLYLIIGD